MTKKEGLKRLRCSVNDFLSSLDDPNQALYLLYFADLKNFLDKLNKEARKWTGKGNNIYLLRTIIIFYDSLRHLKQEEVGNISLEQRKMIWEIANKEINGRIQRRRYCEIYKRLISAGFRIIPYPNPAE